MRVLIADDKIPARQRLKQLLVAHPAFEVVGEAASGAETMRLTAELKPDLLLLDIHMTEGSGLDVAGCLPAPRPAIIFCTAFDQYAVDAFELNALDYLLKPVSRVRLEKTLSRFTSKPLGEYDSGIDQVLRSSEAPLTRFLVKSGARYLVVPSKDVAYFESVDGLTKLVTVLGKDHWMDPSLQEIESRLSLQQFFRISRSVLVSVNAIEEVHPLQGGGASVLLKNKRQLDVSRRRVRDLLTILEKGQLRD